MDINIVALVTAALISIASAVYLYSRYQLEYWTRRGVEQIPDAHWLFGNFKDAILFRSAPGWHLMKHYNQCSKDARFFGFYIFHKPCLQIRDPELIKQIFVKDFDNFCDRYSMGCREKDSIGMRNLFGLRNPLWNYLRRKITPTFTTDKIKKMLPLMLESSAPMMDYIKDLETDENGVKYIDGQELNVKYATDVIANVGFGTCIDSFKNPDSEFTKKTQEFFCSVKRFVALVSIFFLPRLVDALGKFLYFDMSFIKRYFWTAVESREKTGIQRGDYIDSVLKLREGQQDPQYKLEGTNLLSQASQFFSGFESNAVTSTFTLMELAQNKEAQNRAREEVKKAIAEHGWSYEAFNAMEYIENCVLEGLRLYPPVPTLDRRTRQDYNIPGTNVVIEKGTGIYVASSALHRDPRHFPAPEAFDPDRFSGGSSKVAAFAPFGIGPRMCVASKLAVLHVKIVLALVLSEYEVQYRRSGAALLDQRATFTVANKGVKLGLTKLK